MTTERESDAVEFVPGWLTDQVTKSVAGLEELPPGLREMLSQPNCSSRHGMDEHGDDDFNPHHEGG